MKKSEIKSLVGYHHYYMMGVLDAVQAVRDRLITARLDGWRAGYSMWSEDVPAGGIRVGQVRVRSGDPQSALWVKKI